MLIWSFNVCCNGILCYMLLDGCTERLVDFDPEAKGQSDVENQAPDDGTGSGLSNGSLS